jgi:hypothetical protein
VFTTQTIRALLSAAVLGIGAASASASMLAQASPGSPGPEAVAPDFRQLRQEAAQARSPEALFGVFDINQDGCIDDGEWRRRVMAVFFVLDTQGSDPITPGSGGDGQLTRAEAPDLREDLFRAADANRDGMISGFEFNQATFTHDDAVPRQTPGCITLPEFTAYVRSLRAGAF